VYGEGARLGGVRLAGVTEWPWCGAPVAWCPSHAETADVSVRRQEEEAVVGPLNLHAFFSRVLLSGRMRSRNCSR